MYVCVHIYTYIYLYGVQGVHTKHTQTHVHDMYVQICVCIVVMYRAFGFLLQEHCITMTRPENKVSKTSSSSFVYDRYDKVCIGIPMSIETRTDMHAATYT